MPTTKRTNNRNGKTNGQFVSSPSNDDLIGVHRVIVGGMPRDASPTENEKRDAESKRLKSQIKKLLAMVKDLTERLALSVASADSFLIENRKLRDANDCLKAENRRLASENRKLASDEDTIRNERDVYRLNNRELRENLLSLQAALTNTAKVRDILLRSCLQRCTTEDGQTAYRFGPPLDPELTFESPDQATTAIYSDIQRKMTDQR